MQRKELLIAPPFKTITSLKKGLDLRGKEGGGDGF
jgi:hypothetical protein